MAHQAPYRHSPYLRWAQTPAVAAGEVAGVEEGGEQLTVPSLIQTIDAMLAVVPTTEVDLRGDLGRIRSSATFTAPEQMGWRWQYVAQVLGHYLPQPDSSGRLPGEVPPLV